jgi:hypothetical protein
MQTSLLSLIRKNQPRRALLTSYTLSVSWFETFALPALRRYGCEQVDLLVDYRKANESTQEAASQYAGSAYRIIPVFMPTSGIFHPKIAYFEGIRSDSTDTLIIGSGNLTHAGQGKNLEIFDAVDHDHHPHVFAEFADFLTQFSARYEFSAENLKALKHFEERARAKGATDLRADHDARTTWLVHTMTRSAAAQLTELAAGTLEQPTALTVLAPYHSPSGGPVARLAHALEVTDLMIGLSGGSRAAPFKQDTLELPEDVTYVVPMTADGHRFAHAKHFEVRSSEASLLMTGSINATAQSLETMKNVEMSLVRKMPVSPLDWEKVQPAVFEPCDFADENHNKDLLSLQASWTGDNWIQGTVLPAGSPQVVELSVWEGDNCLAVRPDVEVLASGDFRVRMAGFPDANDALVLQLQNEEVCVRGWLNMEYELSGSLINRSLIRSSGKLISGDYTVDDVKAVFLWMEGLLAGKPEHAEPPNKQKLNTNSGNARYTPPGLANVSYDDWCAEALEQSTGGSTPKAVAKFSIAAAFAWLNRDLSASSDDASAGSGPKQGTSRNSDIRLLDTARSEFDNNAGLSNAQQSADESGEALYQALLENLPRALEKDNSSTMAALVVQMSGSAALKRAMVAPAPYPGQDAASASAIARRAVEYWLAQYSQLDYGDRNREALLPFFCALTCSTLYYNPGTSTETLNESLQCLAKRSVTAAEIASLGNLALTTDRFARVPRTLHAAILTGASFIANSVTATHQLSLLLRELFYPTGTSSGKAPPPFTATFADLKVRVKSTKLKDKKFGVVETTKAFKKFCPCCNLTIDRDDLSKLRANRVFTCRTPNCQSPLFFGLNPAELKKMGLGDHFRSC